VEIDLPSHIERVSSGSNAVRVLQAGTNNKVPLVDFEYPRRFFGGRSRFSEDHNREAWEAVLPIYEVYHAKLLGTIEMVRTVSDALDKLETDKQLRDVFPQFAKYLETETVEGAVIATETHDEIQKFFGVREGAGE